MPNYHPELPPGCPPNDAAPMTGTVFRRTKKPPTTITNQDFHSSRELGDQAPGSECQRWGTSVWVDMADVLRDLENFAAYLPKYRIVAFDVTPDHGVIKHTPTNDRPHHHTFWRDATIDFSEICTIVYSPVAAEMPDAI